MALVPPPVSFGKEAECGEAVCCSWPPVVDGLQADGSHDGRDDDHVVGVAEDGDEVGDQVDG